ncbi:S8 family peptidase [Microbacterium sp.]|uniref:S8 family peptidase n=1 Tax=Microbacterium sp. TaxID=51671 RepID=UPI003A9147D9
MIAAGGLAGAAHAAQSSPAEPSTPVPIVAEDGQVMSYILNARNANPGQTRLVEKAIAAAGGVVVQSWPQIGVVVAHSDRASFRADVARSGGNALQSVGPTRTVPVLEGTPAEAQAPWGPGASDENKGKNKKANGDIESVTTPFTGDPDAREIDQWDLRLIKADQAHAITDGSRNVLVGVLDSGISPEHPDLKPNIDVASSVNCTEAGRPDTSADGWYPTTSDHGTHVAGTIAAARNGVGVVGVAPGVRLASVKVVSDEGYIYPEYAVCGFMWAGEHKMDVTNNSYYVDPFEFWCGDQPEQAAALEAVSRAVAWSTGRGVVNVAALGNSAVDLRTNTTDNGSPNDAATPTPRTINDTCKDMPAQLPGVVGVSSITSTGQLSYFSNRGLGETDVAAPGSSILSTVVNTRTGINGYGTKSGTSMASPHVAGVLALMKSAHPSFTPAQLTAKLRADATDTACSAPQLNRGPACEGTLEYNSYYGDGIVDALKAVQ